MVRSKNKRKNIPSRLYEWDEKFWITGQKVLAGVDEAGRGAIAGPVVAGAVVLRYGPGETMQLNDSKLLTGMERQVLYHEICRNTLAIGIGSASQSEIDEINILEASKRAMQIAVQNVERILRKTVGKGIDLIVSDAVIIPGVQSEVKPIIQGDQKSACIAAASIVAKVSRDAIMHALDRVYPGYDWYKNKGYPTRYHKSMLKKKGITPVHRNTFAPVRLLIQGSLG